jgi:hypothetical protein
MRQSATLRAYGPTGIPFEPTCKQDPLLNLKPGEEHCMNPDVEPEYRYQRYRDAEGRVQLADAVVLSLDLLGTRAEAAEEAQRYLEITNDALARANQWVGDKASTTVVRWFSDNVAMAHPLETDDPENLTFGFHIITAAWMQLELAMKGLFARGGMALGPFFASETFLYGPALIDAYETESKKAIYPRVVLHETAVAFALAELESFGGGKEEHRTLLAVDRDGLPFINYLASVFDEPDEAEAMVINHKRHIQSCLEQHKGDPHVHLKYEWLADYNDRFCRGNFPPGSRTDLVIRAEDGPGLVPFGEEVPTPKPPPNTGLPI